MQCANGPWIWLLQDVLCVCGSLWAWASASQSCLGLCRSSFVLCCTPAATSIPSFQVKKGEFWVTWSFLFDNFFRKSLGITSLLTLFWDNLFDLKFKDNCFLNEWALFVLIDSCCPCDDYTVAYLDFELGCPLWFRLWLVTPGLKNSFEITGMAVLWLLSLCTVGKIEKNQENNQQCKNHQSVVSQKCTRFSGWFPQSISSPQSSKMISYW